MEKAIIDVNDMSLFCCCIGCKKKIRLRATPTVILDGYELPEMFFQEI